MAIVSIADPDVEVGVEGGVLVLRRQGQLLRRLVEREVEELHLTGPVELTAGARHLLLRRGIDTVFLTMDGRVRGRLVASEGNQGDRRLLQYAAIQDAPHRLSVARAVVAGKLTNQRMLLLQRQRTLRVEAVADALAGLRASVGHLGAAKDLDSLRGREGDAAARYFGTFPALLRNPAFTWPGRNRRPPKDPVNACLSYGYTLLVVRVAHAVRSAGLDPYLGVLHEAGRGKEALALIKASAIVLVTDFAGWQLSARNQLAGTVSRVEKGAVSSLVVLTLPGGAAITSSVTNEGVEALGLKVGRAATAVFKAYSVMVAAQA